MLQRQEVVVTGNFSHLECSLKLNTFCFRKSLSPLTPIIITTTISCLSDNILEEMYYIGIGGNTTHSQTIDLKRKQKQKH